jgi:integrase
MAEDFYVYKRSGRKNYYAQFRDPKTGELGAAVSTGCSSEAAALRWAKKRLLELDEEAQRDATVTLGEYAEPFFGPACHYVARKLEEGKTLSTLYVRNNRTYVERFILPDPIAAIPLRELKRRDVLAWRSRLVAENGARRSSERALACLKVILSEAVYEELLDYSPASRVAPPAYDRKERQALELETLREVLLPSRYAEPRHWIATLAAAATGMRAAEIRALTWANVDFERRVIRVVQAFKDQAHRLGPPKSGKPRVVPMAAVLVGALRAWRDRMPPEDLGDWVFGFSKNRPLGYKEWLAAFKKAAKGAGVPTASLHTLRHTLNTHLRGEVDDVRLRSSFGWSGPVIQDAYTHADAMDWQRQAQAIDGLLDAPPRP